VACPIKISSSSLLVVFEGRRRRAIVGGVRVERWCDAAVVHRRIIADAGSELGVGVVGERRRLEIKEVGWSWPMWRKLRRSGGSREENGGDTRRRRPMLNRRDHAVKRRGSRDRATL
jgi:hypothetical protein